MTIQNFGDFQWNDELTVEQNLKNHAGFITKNNKSAWEKESAQMLQNEKAKWEVSKNNEIFANSITNETNRKVVSKLLASGSTIDEIKTDFKEFLNPQEPVKVIEPTPNTNTGDVLKFLNGVENTEIEKILNKRPSELTDDELVIRANYNTTQRLKEK